MMPKWKPAVKDGKKVEMEFVKPFNYYQSQSKRKTEGRSMRLTFIEGVEAQFT